MGFNSFFYILVFLPLSIVGYFTLNRLKKYTEANVFLILVSLWFIGYFNVIYTLILCGSIFINFLLGMIIGRVSTSRIKQSILGIAILCNATSLFYFKYYNFFIDNINYFDIIELT